MQASLNGVTIAFDVQGSGEPILFLHGFPLERSIWRAQLPLAAPWGTAVAPDLRGHGESEAPAGAYALETLARDQLALLDHLGARRARIVGHSWGGYIAFALWRLAPERVAGLALINTRAAADTQAGKAGRLQNVADARDQGVPAVTERLVSKMFAPGADAALVQGVAQQMARTPLNGLCGALLGMAERPDSTALLPKINVPVLVVAGEHDQIVPLDESRAMAAALPQARLAVVPGAGHMSMLEDPAAFNEALSAYLRER